MVIYIKFKKNFITHLSFLITHQLTFDRPTASHSYYLPYVHHWISSFIVIVHRLISNRRWIIYFCGTCTSPEFAFRPSSDSSSSSSHNAQNHHEGKSNNYYYYTNTIVKYKQLNHLLCFTHCKKKNGVNPGGVGVNIFGIKFQRNRC